MGISYKIHALKLYLIGGEENENKTNHNTI